MSFKLTMNFDAVDAFVESLLREVPLAGAALVVSRGERVVHARSYGALTLEARLPVASASKWVSAAIIATLIDDGTLHLDERASDYIGSFGDDKATITLRQLLAHTSGLPKGEAPCVSDAASTLEACADAIAHLPMSAMPGVQFAYGENSYQVAGRMAEVATGTAWHDLFIERIAAPLGMTATDYAMRSVDDGIVPIANPRISSGLRSTARDLSYYTRMMASGGAGVLRPETIALMFEDQTFGAPVTFSPNLFPGQGYGLGVWRERVNEWGRAIQVSSPGAFGTTPWVDVELGLGGVFICRNAYGRMAAPVREVQRLVGEVLID